MSAIPVTIEGATRVTFFGTRGAPLVLDVEVADTRSELESGLMYRTEGSLDPDDGVLFVLEQPERGIRLWMKNTRIPLDAAFVSDGGKVLGVRRLEPYSEQRIGVGDDATVAYIVEANSGVLDRVRGGGYRMVTSDW